MGSPPRRLLPGLSVACPVGSLASGRGWPEGAWGSGRLAGLQEAALHSLASAQEPISAWTSSLLVSEGLSPLAPGWGSRGRGRRAQRCRPGLAPQLRVGGPGHFSRRRGPWPCRPPPRPCSACSPACPGSQPAGQPAPRGAQRPQPRAAGTVQAEGAPV